MKEKILVIKAKFEMIRIVLGDKLKLEDLSHPKYLKVLIDATENTYLQLNDSICESLVMCKECAKKRDILNSYINILDNIELGIESNADIEEKLSRYPEVVDEIIEKIESVLTKMQ